jgi:hypothetical protein
VSCDSFAAVTAARHRSRPFESQAISLRRSMTLSRRSFQQSSQSRSVLLWRHGSMVRRSAGNVAGSSHRFPFSRVLFARVRSVVLVRA